MRRFRNILVVPMTRRAEPPPGLREAVALADVSGARLRLLGHIDDDQGLLDVPSSHPDGPEIRQVRARGVPAVLSPALQRGRR